MLTQKIFGAAQNGAEIILYILLLTSVLSVTLILERYFSLRSVRSRSGKVKKRLQEALQANNLSDLEEISKDRESLEGRTLAFAFRHLKEKGANGLEEIFNSVIMMERAPLEKYLSFLATVGSNAPFVGLLGTVLGIMKAFNDLGTTQGNPSIIMIGIAEALVSTAVGLFVAIPAIIAYNYFQRQVKQTLQSLDSVKELAMSYTKGRVSDGVKV